VRSGVSIKVGARRAEQPDWKRRAERRQQRVEVTDQDHFEHSLFSSESAEQDAAEALYQPECERLLLAVGLPRRGQELRRADDAPLLEDEEYCAISLSDFSR